MKTEEHKIGENTFKIREISFYDQCEYQNKHEGTGKLKPREIIEMSVIEPEITDE